MRTVIIIVAVALLIAWLDAYTYKGRQRVQMRRNRAKRNADFEFKPRAGETEYQKLHRDMRWPIIPTQRDRRNRGDR